MMAVGDKTKIQWTDATWNPIRGCSRISAGCERCYAETVAGRFSGPGQPYEGLVRLRASGKHGRAQWNGVVRPVPKHLAAPLRWRKPRRVFVNSMSDLFHESLPVATIARVFAIMALAERHTFQVLTKRAGRMREVLTSDDFWWLVTRDVEELARTHPTPDAPRTAGAWAGFDAWTIGLRERRCLPNVWLGISAEDQRAADERVPVLLDTPAAVRWVSYEPALGPVDFSCFVTGREPIAGIISPSVGFRIVPRLDWIVVGGESGPGARPCRIEWIRDTVEACHEAGVACFVKQLGSKPHGAHSALGLTHTKGGDLEEWPFALRVREWPASHGGAR